MTVRYSAFSASIDGMDSIIERELGGSLETRLSVEGHSSELPCYGKVVSCCAICMSGSLLVSRKLTMLWQYGHQRMSLHPESIALMNGVCRLISLQPLSAAML
jgi:hypothetical protein